MLLILRTCKLQHYKEEYARNPRSWPSVPIALKEINNVFGRCFFLSTEEFATVEQKFEGNISNQTEWCNSFFLP